MCVCVYVHMYVYQYISSVDQEKYQLHGFYVSQCPGHLNCFCLSYQRLPWWLSGKESACQ